jgi:hypothetical protein
MVKCGLKLQVTDQTIEIAPEINNSPELQESIADNLTAEQRNRARQTTTLNIVTKNVFPEKEVHCNGFAH